LPQARASALRFSAPLSQRGGLRFALGGGLDPSDGQPDAAWLMADRADAARALALAPDRAFAADWTLAQGGRLTVAAERGDIGAPDPWRLDPRQRADAGQRSSFDRIAAGYHIDGDRLGAGVTLSWLREDRSILGARFDALFGAGGSSAAMADVAAHWRPSRDWAFGLGWRGLVARPDRGGRLTGGRLFAQGWSADAARANLFGAGDQLALRLAQPLRVESGGIAFTLPTDYDYSLRRATDTRQVLPLVPSGREVAAELAYAVPAGPGVLTLNGWWRNEPGHRADTDDDRGAAIRFALGF
jgi:hypothetical protein